MSDYDLPIDWKPEPNKGDDPIEIDFNFNIETTTWLFENGDRLELEKNDYGYLFGGCVGGQDIHDEDHEDFFFKDSDELLNFFEKHGLLQLLSRFTQ